MRSVIKTLFLQSTHPYNARYRGILLYCLAQSLYSLHFQSGEMFPAEDRRNAATEAIELLKKALHYSDKKFDEDGCCRQLLVYNYLVIGEYEKTKQAALKAPFIPLP